MLKNIFKAFIVVAGFASSILHAECYNIATTGGISKVGPIDLLRTTNQVCVNRTTGYYRISFYSVAGPEASFFSRGEVLKKCPGFCAEYVLEAGSQQGRNVDPDRTKIAFQVEGRMRTVTIVYRGGVSNYDLGGSR
jgi:hypothetical protein